MKITVMAPQPYARSLDTVQFGNIGGGQPPLPPLKGKFYDHAASVEVSKHRLLFRRKRLGMDPKKKIQLQDAFALFQFFSSEG